MTTSYLRSENAADCNEKAQNTQDRHLLVFKGGTAFNSLLEAFHRRYPQTAYIVPVSDDGGSSREICRVFGGPGIGDIRSTLTRLSDASSPEASAVKRLLEYRLSPVDEHLASLEWHQFLEDKHPLYRYISSPYKGLIRSFLCKFEEIRLQKIKAHFDLRNGSIGNFFFTGARIVLGSLETAIFVYSSVARIGSSTRMLPVVESGGRMTIAAMLENGDRVIGQNAISHPSISHLLNKEGWEPLPAAIKQLYYVNKYRDLIHPEVNPSVIEEIGRCDGIVYGIGSFWTSIIPSLILEGVGEAIAGQECPKVAMLNSYPDRETVGMTAMGYLLHLRDSLNRQGALNHPVHKYVNHLFVVENVPIPVEEDKIRKLGVKIYHVPAAADVKMSLGVKKFPIFEGNRFLKALDKADLWQTKR